MTTAKVAFLIVGIAVIAFAVLNPNLEVEFSALLIAYRGNTLGLGLVLFALAFCGYGIGNVLVKLTGKRRRAG